jgi:hypothetical protein
VRAPDVATEMSAQSNRLELADEAVQDAAERLAEAHEVTAQFQALASARPAEHQWLRQLALQILEQSYDEHDTSRYAVSDLRAGSLLRHVKLARESDEATRSTLDELMELVQTNRLSTDVSQKLDKLIAELHEQLAHRQELLQVPIP